MLIFRNAEGVHGQRKVGNPSSRMIKRTDLKTDSFVVFQSSVL